MSANLSGYGFSVMELTTEKVLLFAMRHKSAIYNKSEKLNKILDFYEFYQDKLDKKTDKEILDILALDKKQYNEVLNDIEDWCSGLSGIGAIPSIVIAKETDIRVGYEFDNENEVVILYTSSPWDFNDAEKALKSKDDLKNILLPYMKELDIPEGSFDLYTIYYD